MLLPAYDWTWYEFDEENDPKNYGVLFCDFVQGGDIVNGLCS
jgi:hypothetical protein